MSDDIVRQDEFPQIGAVGGLARTDVRCGESRWLRICVRIECGVGNRPTTWPKPAATDFVRVRLTRHPIRQVRHSARMFRRSASGKSGNRQVGRPPKKMHRAALPDEAGAKLLEDAV